jgi:hypothetical protein
MSACRVFISVRLSEDGDGASLRLREALEAAGISCFLCGGALAGDDLATDVACAVDACELFVVLGTMGYGKQGDCSFSTREELQFAVDHCKPIFPIKRCDEFADPLTRLYLANLRYTCWEPYTPIPEDLVDNIKAKLESAALRDPSGPPGYVRCSPPLSSLLADRSCDCPISLVRSFASDCGRADVLQDTIRRLQVNDPSLTVMK